MVKSKYEYMLDSHMSMQNPEERLCNEELAGLAWPFSLYADLGIPKQALKLRIIKHQY